MPETPADVLIIPIKIDFLHVKDSETTVAEAKVNFSNMPYNDDVEDVNSEFAYISENFISKPFQNNNFFLHQGLHLHWSLPDAFTAGKVETPDNNHQVNHLTVPDRWIVNRKIFSTSLNKWIIEKSWVVESNYLHPEGKDNKYRSIAYPIKVDEGEQSFRYMGRSYCFYVDKDYVGSKQTDMPNYPNKTAYLDKLTAVGYGEQTFAAFYPNCHSVFGFCDREITPNSILTNYEYEVFGWYSKEQNDPLTDSITHTNFSLSSPKCFIEFRNGTYIDIPNNNGIPIGNAPYTIEAWIRPNIHSLNGIVGWGNFGTTNLSNALRLGDGGVLMNYWWYNDIYVSGLNLADGKWHHIAATYDGINRKLFCDGVLLKTDKPVGINIPHAQNFRIGSTNNTEFFNGGIIHVRIWNIAQKDEDIKFYKDVEFNEPQPGLVAYYKLDEVIDQSSINQKYNFYDSSGNANHGILKGLTPIVHYNDKIKRPYFTKYINKEKSGAINFNGINNSISVTNDPIFEFAEGTIELWLKPTWTINRVENPCIIALRDSNETRFSFHIKGDKNSIAFWNGKNAYFYPFIFDTSLWYHVAFVSVSNTVKIYINGSHIGTTPTGFSSVKGKPLTIGYSNDTIHQPKEYFTGELAEIRIWNSVKSESDIRANMAYTIEDPSENLIAYYKCDNGIIYNDNHDSKTLYDSSGNNHHGILINFSLKGIISNWSKAPGILNISNQLKEKFDFKLVSSSFNLDLSSLMSICFAKLKFTNAVNNVAPFVESISIGNTGTEALSALLAKKIDSTNKLYIEEELEAINLLSKVAGKKLDLDASFDIAYHEKGFSSVDSGIIWNIKITNAYEDEKDKNAGIDITLPDSFANWVNELNLLQQSLDKNKDKLISLQQNLYADWYKYMIAAYHPQFETGIPQMDNIRFFIENNSASIVEQTLNEIRDIEIKIQDEFSIVNKLIGCFNYGLEFSEATFDNDGTINSDRINNDKFRFKKNIVDINYTFPITKDITNGVLYNVIASPDLSNVYVKQFEASDFGEKIYINGIDQNKICAISFMINISSNQPIDKVYASQLVKITLLDETKFPVLVTEPEIYSISKDNIGSFWQSIYIDGKMIDPYKETQWDDFPKDKWVHVFLKGSGVINQALNLAIMSELKGSVAGIRLFNEGLTSMELFCDTNMLCLKKMNLIQDKAPRYWQATEPVVLINGEIAEPSARYGFDDNLPCLILPFGVKRNIDVSDDQFFVSTKKNDYYTGLQDISKIYEQVAFFAGFYPTFKAAFENLPNSMIPWNPLILEWQVGITPFEDSGLLLDQKFNNNLIVDRYKLNNNQPELIQKNRNIPNGLIKIFTGSTILTPHAKVSMIEIIHRYFEGIHADDADWLNYEHGFKNPFVDINNNPDYTKIIFEAKTIPDDANDEISINLKNYIKPSITNTEKIAIEVYLASIKRGRDWNNYYGKSNSFINPFTTNNKADSTKILNTTTSSNSKDTINLCLLAYKEINKSNFLSQSLGGFNAALQMLHQTYQLPIADPIGFEDDQLFSDRVRELVANESKYAPMPLVSFDPIRTGQMHLMDINIIDSFGQIIKVYGDSLSKNPEVIYSRTLDNGILPPRIVQASRLNFRWISNNSDMIEMTDHPASSPICGWLVPNNIDDTIIVYDPDGFSLGILSEYPFIDTNGNTITKTIWKSIPGSLHPTSVDQIPNIHLKSLINHFLEVPKITLLIELLEKTMDQIDPENFAQHTDLAMLMGKPIAVVRASVGLDIKGNPVINQDWDSFENDMNKTLNKSAEDTSFTSRDTKGWEEIKFPIRIGEHGQLNDSVIGYFIDEHPEMLYSSVPNDDDELAALFGMNTKTMGFDADNPIITRSLADDNLFITILMNPTGVVHASCGVLPSKSLTIPDDQYKPALKNMSVTFFTRPLLMPKGKLTIPLPDEPNYSWSWLEQKNETWKEISTKGNVHFDTFLNAFINGRDIWQELITKGWIKETSNGKAEVIPVNKRLDNDPKPILIEKLDDIQQLLDEGHIVDEVYTPNFTSTNLLKEGWLKLTPNK